MLLSHPVLIPCNKTESIAQVTGLVMSLPIPFAREVFRGPVDMEKHEGLRNALKFELHWGRECRTDEFGGLIAQSHGFHSLQDSASDLHMMSGA